VRAADQDDLYIEVGFGSNFKLSEQMVSELSAGYLPVNELGGGLYFSQQFAGVPRAAPESGTLVGLEVRWFLEPFEVSGVIGRFFKLQEEKNIIMMGASYLYAVSPALAAKVELKARFELDGSSAIISTFGARFLF